MRKWITLIIIFSFLVVGTSNAKIIGDFNNDGKLDIADVIMFIRHLMGFEEVQEIGGELYTSPLIEKKIAVDRFVGTWIDTTFEDRWIFEEDLSWHDEIWSHGEPQQQDVWAYGRFEITDTELMITFKFAHSAQTSDSLYTKLFYLFSEDSKYLKTYNQFNDFITVRKKLE